MKKRRKRKRKNKKKNDNDKSFMFCLLMLNEERVKVSDCLQIGICSECGVKVHVA